MDFTAVPPGNEENRLCSIVIDKPARPLLAPAPELHLQGMTVSRFLPAVTAFWSAILLILVQPALAKAILPWFGGSAGVWTTSMLFFQAMLLAGYLYAHLLQRLRPARVQALVHCALLLLALALLPIRPDAAWKPSGDSDPVPGILGVLLSTVGLPYFLLSATSPLIQAWLSAAPAGRVPWRLFAVSNLGSLLALLSYPAAIEPWLAIRAQLDLWSWGFGIFAVMCAVVALRTAAAPAERAHARWPAAPTVLGWAALAMIPSVAWQAVATKLSEDVGAIPFLWVLPLSLYLLSFVLTFESGRWYRRAWMRWAVPLSVGALAYVRVMPVDVPFSALFLLYLGTVFLICMLCHGELALRRPDRQMLTSFYLSVAVGGAAGGALVAVVAPLLLDRYMEIPLSLLATVVVASVCLYRMPRWAALVVSLGFAALLAYEPPSGDAQIRVRVRNFYGAMRVVDFDQAEERSRVLIHGSIQHGVQFLSPSRRRTATAYYGGSSAAGLMLDLLQAKGPVRVGVIGLGVGTLLAYGRPGDYFRVYELNPAVLDLARNEFSFLRDSQAKYDVVMGDARLSLEKESSGQFDLLVVDAFTGDSVPTHLMTVEALRTYRKHLAPGGWIALNISSRFLNLAPTFQRLAAAEGLYAFRARTGDDARQRIYTADWVLMSQHADLPAPLRAVSRPLSAETGIALWTDGYVNLLSVLN